MESDSRVTARQRVPSMVPSHGVRGNSLLGLKFSCSVQMGGSDLTTAFQWLSESHSTPLSLPLRVLHTMRLHVAHFVQDFPSIRPCEASHAAGVEFLVSRSKHFHFLLCNVQAFIYTYIHTYIHTYIPIALLRKTTKGLHVYRSQDGHLQDCT